MQNGVATLENSLVVSYNAKHGLTVQSSNAIIGHSNELKFYVHLNTYTWMFIVDLFIVAKTWEQLRCSSVGDWISKLGHPYDEILFTDGKTWAIKLWKPIEEFYVHVTKQKKPVWKSYILHVSKHMTFWKRQEV